MREVHIGEVTRVDITAGRVREHLEIWLKGEDQPWFVRVEALHVDGRRFAELKEFLDWFVDISSQDKVADAAFEIGHYGAVVEASFISKEVKKDDTESRLGR